MERFFKKLGEMTYRDAFWLLFGSMLGNHVVDVVVLWFLKLAPSSVPLLPLQPGG